jgi:HK97 gp10 family phage protein
MVEGVQQLRRRLVDELPKKVRAELEAAMLESANRIVAGARLRVPVESGKVRDSIRHHGVKEGRRGGLYVAVTAGDTTTLTDEKGTRYQVARLLEFGTMAMPAQPYMLPSYHANRSSAQRRMRRAIRDSIMRK